MIDAPLVPSVPKFKLEGKPVRSIFEKSGRFGILKLKLKDITCYLCLVELFLFRLQLSLRLCLLVISISLLPIDLFVLT